MKLMMSIINSNGLRVARYADISYEELLVIQKDALEHNYGIYLTPDDREISKERGVYIPDMPNFDNRPADRRTTPCLPAVKQD